MEQSSQKTKLGKLGWLFLLAVALTYFFSNLQKVLVPGATFNELQQMFNLDAATVTSLGAAFMYTYAAMQLVTGPLADRFGGAKVIMFGGIVLCIGSLLSCITSSLALMYLARAMTGFGAATIYLCAVKELNRLLPDSFSVFVGILTIIGYSGGIVGTSPFIAGVHRFGYTAMMLAAAIGVIVIYLLFVGSAVAMRGKSTQATVPFTFSAYKNVYKIANNYRMIIYTGMTFGSYFAIQTVIGKKYLEDYCRMGSIAAGNVMLVTMAIAAFNGFFMALLSRKFGNRKVCFIRIGGTGTHLAALVLLAGTIFKCNSPWLSVPALIIVAICCNMSALTTAIIRENNSPSQFGTILSVSNFSAYIITAVFGGCMGKLMDIIPPKVVDGIKIYSGESYMLVFIVLTILGGIAACLAWRLTEKRG